MGFLQVFWFFLTPYLFLIFLCITNSSKRKHISEMSRREMCQHTALQRAVAHGGPVALKKTSVSLQKTGRTGR